MTDRAIFDIELGDLDWFRNEVIRWVGFWSPDDSATRAMQSCPDAVLAVVLSRPSGWAGCQSISRTLTTALRRHLNVYRGQYDRDDAQEAWVNQRPFDRSGNIFFKNQSPVVRALVMQKWVDRSWGSRQDWSRRLNHVISDVKDELARYPVGWPWVSAHPA
eukprot:14282637-Alexandrium_andersonii.AAC.1